MKMCLVPFLVNHVPTIDSDLWPIASPINSFELGSLFTMASEISQGSFAKCVSCILNKMQKLSGQFNLSLMLENWTGGQIIQIGPFQILLQLMKSEWTGYVIVGERIGDGLVSWPYTKHGFDEDINKEKDNVLLKIRTIPSASLNIETVWVVFQQLGNTIDEEFQLLIPESHLTCPHDKLIIKTHGDIDFEQLCSKERAESSRKIGKKLMECDCSGLDIRFPSKLAMDIAELPAWKRFGASLTLDTVDLLDLHNLMSVLLVKKIEEPLTTISAHPVFQSHEEKASTIVAVRQFFDDLETNCKEICQINSHKPNCMCFVSTNEYQKYYQHFETNGALIIKKGNWEEALDDLKPKLLNTISKPFGNLCSVTAFIRILRNAIVHNDPSEDVKQLVKTIQDLFPLISLHSFTFRTLHIQELVPGLRDFAEAYQLLEAASCKAALETSLIKPLDFASLRIKVFKTRDITLDSISDFLLIFDPQKSVKALKKEIDNRCLLPTEQQEIFYIGLDNSPIATSQSGL
jgi:hypothetical protein